MDANGDNQVTQEEFVQAGPPGPPPGGPFGGPFGGFGFGQRPSPDAIFAKIDANNDGILTQDEVNNKPVPPGFPQPSEEMKAAHWQRLDANSDGQVTKEEFIQAGPPGPPPGGPFGGGFGGQFGGQLGIFGGFGQGQFNPGFFGGNGGFGFPGGLNFFQVRQSA
jgi:hypothetical protein